MKIETPCGSGNTIEIYEGRNGNMGVAIVSKDITGKNVRAGIELLGLGGGLTTKDQEALKKALAPFLEKV